MKNLIKVRVIQRDDTPLGVPSGKTIWHVEVLDSGDAPFTGCPLGRSTISEKAAIADLIRPGYALPYDGVFVRISDVEIVERKDYRTK